MTGDGPFSREIAARSMLAFGLLSATIGLGGLLVISFDDISESAGNALAAAIVGFYRWLFSLTLVDTLTILAAIGVPMAVIGAIMLIPKEGIVIEGPL